MVNYSIVTAAIALAALLGLKGARANAARWLQATELCSCSPQAFQFIISLDPCDNSDTTNNDIANNSGIVNATSKCYKEIGLTPALVAQDIIYEEIQQIIEAKSVTEIWFKEFNLQGDLLQSHADYNIALEDGQFISFFSASKQLNPSLSLEDQINNVPASVEIKLFGINEDNETVSDVITWYYDLSCESEPVKMDDHIGWITVGELFAPRPEFCLLPTPPSKSPSTSMSYGSTYKVSSKMAKAKPSSRSTKKSHESRDGH